MDKFSHYQHFTCARCREKFKTSEAAEACFDGHYTVGKVIGVYYDEPLKRCPTHIQVEISIDGGNSFEKDVFYRVDDGCWGTK